MFVEVLPETDLAEAQEPDAGVLHHLEPVPGKALFQNLLTHRLQTGIYVETERVGHVVREPLQVHLHLGAQRFDEAVVDGRERAVVDHDLGDCLPSLHLDPDRNHEDR